MPIESNFTMQLQMRNYYRLISLVPCLLITQVLKVTGHQQVHCRQWKLKTELIWAIATSYGVTNLLNIGPGNSLLPDGAKPVPDSMLTSCRYAPMYAQEPWMGGSWDGEPDMHITYALTLDNFFLKEIKISEIIAMIYELRNPLQKMCDLITCLNLRFNYPLQIQWKCLLWLSAK